MASKAAPQAVQRGRGFLERLRRDTRGNTIAMAAAALIPLVGLVGGAIDASRYYMTSTRMQNACDSGALAARKAMGNRTWTTTADTTAKRFFDQNFPDKSFGSYQIVRNYTADAKGKVTGTASGKLPVSLMQIMGFSGFDIAVTCSADINISNTDIMFVLDVTGSMNCPDDGSNCPNGNNNNSEATNARIKGLRAAVLSFYDTVQASTSTSAQVRYGMMPYASNVNVGRSIPAQYMAKTADYQTRRPHMSPESTSWEFVSYTITSVSNKKSESRNGYANVTEQSANSETQCRNKMPAAVNNVYVDGSLQGDTLVLNSQSQTGNRRTSKYTGEGTFYRGVPGYLWDSSNKRCYVGHERYDFDATFKFDYVEDQKVTPAKFEYWIYERFGWDVSNFYTGGNVTLPTGYQGANQAHSWTGCIEEADTVAESVWNPVPAGAYDLDINLKPSNAREYWKPQLPNAVYKREQNGNTLDTLYQTGDEYRPGYDCPKAAMKLTSMDRSTLVDYLDRDKGFDARSSTYHDIGMIWGARFIAPDGIFSADNATAGNGDAIARHIVFMTDGDLAPNNEIYNTYGIEWWDRRVSGNGANGTATNNHAARFQAACRAARNENISVWVVAFGTTLTQNLIDCATPGRAFSASNSAQLQAKFQEIAEKIAALRLVQ